MSYRHSKHRGWRERGYMRTPLTPAEEEMRRAAEEEKVAHIVDFFNSEYGEDGSSLEKWQRLCEKTSVKSLAPPLLDARWFVCVSSPSVDKTLTVRQTLDGAHINIVDFVAAMSKGEKAYRFESEQALRDYIVKHHHKIPNKTFPLHEAESNGFLSGLLIHVWVFGGSTKQGEKSALIKNETDVEQAAYVDEDIEPEDVDEHVEPEDEGEHVEPEDEGEHVEPEDEGEHVEPEDVVMLDVEMRDVDMVDVDMLGEET